MNYYTIYLNIDKIEIDNIHIYNALFDLWFLNQFDCN